jgi:hypothetical protein
VETFAEEPALAAPRRSGAEPSQAEVSQGRSLTTTAWRVVGRDVPFLLLAGGYVALAHFLGWWTGIPRQVTLDPSWRILTMWVLLYSVPASVLILVYTVVTERGFLFDYRTWFSAVRRFWNPAATTRFAIIFLLIPTFTTAYVAFKASIPLVRPFDWDVPFFVLDRMLHGGTDPWRLLHPLLGRPGVTHFIDLLYYLWLPLLWLTIVWQAWHGAKISNAREQFLLSFAACAILLGTGLAFVFSSAGPAYYGRVVAGPNPYEPLLQYLYGVDASSSLHALRLHELLWNSYSSPETQRVASGISAMPSMHISMATLMALLGFRIHRILGWAYLIFAVCIVVGSVHLAWHYAVDGYLAIICTIAIWALCGRITESWRAHLAARGLT